MTTIDTHETRLEALQLDPQSYRALLALPLVFVWWRLGHQRPEARERITRGAVAAFGLNGVAQAKVRAWLAYRPTHTYFEEGFRELKKLAAAPDEPQFDFDLLQAALTQAEHANMATLKPRPDAAYRTATLALGKVARSLGLEHGDTWNALLADLEAEPTPVRSAVAEAPSATIEGDEIRVGVEEPKTPRDPAPVRRLRTAVRLQNDGLKPGDGGLI